MRWAALTLIVLTLALGAGAAPASAGVGSAICNVGGLVSGVVGKACNLLEHGGQLVRAGKKLVSGHIGGAVSTVLGGGGSSSGGSSASTALGLAAIGAWVLGGAKFALSETAKVLSNTTRPQLNSTWFSSTYWRIAGIAAVLTLPFLFAASIQALMRSDLALLMRAAFGYLPLAFLGVSVAAPLAMLLLAASDQLSAAVASTGSGGGTHYLVLAGAGAGLLSLLHGSPFLAFLVGLFTVAGAVVLWIELLARQAAVYVVVLMLPLAFAALAWPARRIWAIRAVELLVALILSKFAIVAVLALGGAALGHSSGGGITAMLAGLVLVVMGTLAPWAMLRLLPLAELASGAMSSLRADARAVRGPLEVADATAQDMSGWASSVTAQLRRQVEPGDSDAAVRGGAEAETERLAEAGRAPHTDPDAGSDPEPYYADGDIRAGDGLEPENQSAATAEKPAEDPSASDPGERIPGAAPIFQAEDLTLPPLTLGYDESGRPGITEWPPSQEPDAAPGPPGADGKPSSPEPDRPPRERDQGPAAPADDPDSRPPAQEPEDGRL